MSLLTESQKSQLIANAHAGSEAAQHGREIDPFPVVKLVARDSRLVWLLAALDPYRGDCAYGLFYGHNGLPYEGFTFLSDIEKEVLKYGCRVECDPDFVATKPLSAYTSVAQARGLIER